jgi:hypothetical protein
MAYNSSLFSLRVFRWSILAYFMGRGDFSHSLALERTADRRVSLLSMSSTLKPEAKRAVVSGRSACSR